jgi:hypothetical protein
VIGGVAIPEATFEKLAYSLQIRFVIDAGPTVPISAPPIQSDCRCTWAVCLYLTFIWR